MEFIKLLKAGSIISGINWAIYLIHEWVNFAKNNPPEVLSEGDPIFLGLIAQSIASISLIGFGVFYKGTGPTNVSSENTKTRNKPHLTAPPSNFSRPPENAVPERTEPIATPIPNIQAAPVNLVTPVAENLFEPSMVAINSSIVRPTTVKSPDSSHRLIILILLVVGLIGAAIYYAKQKNNEAIEQIVKAEPREENSIVPLPIAITTLSATEAINKRWLGKWVDGNTLISITDELLTLTNIETKTEMPFKWLGSEPVENPNEAISFYGKTISKANLLAYFEKYSSGLSNLSDEQKNQLEQVKKLLDELSDGSYRMIRLKMSWSAGIYRSYILDKTNIFKLDFESEESLSAITRYRKMN